jgi:hypothetical protein
MDDIQTCNNAIKDALVMLLRELRQRYPDQDVANRVAREALLQAGVKVSAVNEFMATAPRPKVW